MCHDCDWPNTLERIMDLINSPKLTSSERDYLYDVHAWIEEKGHATVRQKEAVAGIGERHGC